MFCIPVQGLRMWGEAKLKCASLYFRRDGQDIVCYWGSGTGSGNLLQLNLKPAPDLNDKSRKSCRKSISTLRN